MIAREDPARLEEALRRGLEGVPGIAHGRLLACRDEVVAATAIAALVLVTDRRDRPRAPA